MTVVGRSSGSLPPGAFVLALSCLPGAGPGWVRALLSRYEPGQAWEQVVTGRTAPPASVVARTGAAAWAIAAARTDVGANWGRCTGAGIEVLWPGRAGYPEVLSTGPSPCGPLFVLGAATALQPGPMVALVGTRRCTPDGRTVAYELARDLAQRGVTVVSGLALGIDGAAHSGALAGALPGSVCTVGVAASGVDVVYPRRHRALWAAVAGDGAVVSETPPGWPAQGWRFPARNRIIAGLARLVVVVESHIQGGSWHTVDAALARGVDVAAVPGPVHSPASAGTNRMLANGAALVTSADDIVALMSMPGPAPVADERSARPRSAASRAPTPGDGAAALRLALPGPATPFQAVDAPARRREVGPVDRTSGLVPGPVATALLRTMPLRPSCLDQVLERAGLPVGAALRALEELRQAGLASEQDGWWWRSG